MRREILRSTLLLALGFPLLAQQPVVPIQVKLPNATVGLAYEANLADPVIAQLPPESTLVSLIVTPPNNVPAGLVLATSGRLSGAPTVAGNFNFTVNGRVSVIANNTTFTSPFILQVSLIAEGKAGGISVAPTAVSLSSTVGGPAVSKGIPITNTGSAIRSFTVAVRSTGSWLSAAPTAGRLPGFGSTVIVVTANPARLAIGLYTGTVIISGLDASERFEIPVSLNTGATEQTLSVTQSGMTLTTEQGQTPPAQTLQVRSTSRNGEAFTILTFVAGPAGAASWLSVTPSTGTIAAGRPASVAVRANPAGLTAGVHYGHLEISAGRTSASRIVSIVLNVLPPNSPLVPEIQPTGLAFVQRPSAPAPAQQVALSNVFGRPLTAAMSAEFTGPAQNWFTVSPSSLTIATGQTTAFSVARSSTVRLAAGVHRGSVAIRVSGTVRRVAVMAIVLPGAENLVTSERTNSADGCTPTSLEPVVTTLSQGFSSATSWPIAIRAKVLDSCGDPLVDGTVTAAFTNGDPPLSLSTEGNGDWAGSWTPRSGSANTVITIHATSAQSQLEGEWPLGGTVSENPNEKPSIDLDGVQSAASQIPERRIAAGSFIAIRGKGLAPALQVAPDGRLPTNLSGTFVVLSGGLRLPLYFVHPDILSGIVPFNFPVTSGKANLILYRGTAPSEVVEVDVTPTQPGLFTQSATGKGVGSILRYRGSEAPVVVGPANRVRPDDLVAIYGAGLGPLDATIDAGAVVAASPLIRTSALPTVTIGGIAAEVTYSGMVPTTPAGLYVVNAWVPTNVPRNRDVEVIVTAGAEASQAVLLPVE